MILIESDWSKVEHEWDRLEKLPDLDMNMALYTVLVAVMGAAQAAVHVQTGSLKASAKITVDEQLSRWIGTLSFGGASTGIKNPVTYAIYERARGGPHDFIDGLDVFHRQWLAAIKKGLKP